MANIIWINGATSPSGTLLAQHYSANGDKIIISGGNRDELYTLKSICKGNPMNMHIVITDHNKPDKMLDWTKEALRIFGRIDTLLICGQSPLNKLATETNQEEANAVMTQNFWSSVALAKAVLPIMKRQEGGHIWVFTTVAGKIGIANQSAFSAAQHGLHGYFDSLREEQTLPIHISLVVGELENTEGSVEKFLKKIEKFPEEIILNEEDKKLLKSKSAGLKTFFKRM